MYFPFIQLRFLYYIAVIILRNYKKEKRISVTIIGNNFVDR